MLRIAFINLFDFEHFAEQVGVIDLHEQKWMKVFSIIVLTFAMNDLNNDKNKKYTIDIDRIHGFDYEFVDNDD